MADIPMTDEECRVATDRLSEQLDLYASLLVRKGVALRPGQELVLQAPVERADFVRRVVRAAYRCDAGHVTVIWADDEVSRLTYENCPLEFFEHTPSWQVEQLNSLAEAGAAFLFLVGPGPHHPARHRPGQARRGLPRPQHRVSLVPRRHGLWPQRLVHRRRSGRGLGP